MSYLWLEKSWRSIALCWLFLLIFTGCGYQLRGVEEIPLDRERLYLKWSFDSGGAINHPIVVTDDSVLFVPHNGTLIALDAASGNCVGSMMLPQKYGNALMRLMVDVFLLV